MKKMIATCTVSAMQLCYEKGHVWTAGRTKTTCAIIVKLGIMHNVIDFTNLLASLTSGRKVSPHTYVKCTDTA